LPDGAQDRPYTAALAATGGAAPYAWSLASGSLPDGLNLGSSTGVITGAPTTPGTSSFTVRATDSNSRTATGALSITIHPESPAIVEENDPSVGYTGTWYAVSAPFTHGGGAVLATEEGASATIRFAGTGIRWVGLSDEWSGIAFVFVDGVLLEPRDTYRTPGEAQVVEYGVGGLTGGTHALTIVVTGRQNPASGGAWIWVDAFVIQP
jgi:hypothetical protein